MRSSSILFLLCSLTLLAAGCGDDDGVATDAGPVGGDAGPRPDAGPDETACISSAVVPMCTRRPGGMPLWEPVDPQVFVGPMGTMASMFAEAQTFEGMWLMPNHQFDIAHSLAAPAMQHAGPYTGDLSTMLSTHGITASRVLTEAQYTAPSGVWISMVLVPSTGAPTGSSFDSDSGPIIPNDIFPIAIDCDLFQDGLPYDMNFDSMYPAYNDTSPPAPKDGWSHIILVFAENTEFAPPMVAATGDFELRCAFADNTGMNGWVVTVPFRVQ